GMSDMQRPGRASAVQPQGAHCQRVTGGEPLPRRNPAAKYARAVGADRQAGVPVSAAELEPADLLAGSGVPEADLASPVDACQVSAGLVEGQAADACVSGPG